MTNITDHCVDNISLTLTHFMNDFGFHNKYCRSLSCMFLFSQIVSLSFDNYRSVHSVLKDDSSSSDEQEAFDDDLGKDLVLVIMYIIAVFVYVLQTLHTL